MDLNLMRSLVAVAEAGAITEAAARLGLTQPALTRRIQQLEAELGAPLLERSRRGATLTALGERVVREARTLIQRFDALKSEVASQGGEAAGTVRIGGGATAVSFLLPDLIADYQRAHPGVRFHVKEASSSEVARDVADGRLELGLVTEPVRAAGLDIDRLFADDIVLVAAADSAFAQRSSVEVAELDGRSFVGFEVGSAIRQIVDAALREAGVEVQVVMELRSIPAILRMVATTGNLAFVSRLGVLGQDLVRALEVEGLSITRPLGLARRKGLVLTPPAGPFAEQILRRFAAPP
ncbi:MAG: LysR family transcriptional regulator [Pseudomonadota bacterium]